MASLYGSCDSLSSYGSFDSLSTISDRGHLQAYSNARASAPKHAKHYAGSIENIRLYLTHCTDNAGPYGRYQIADDDQDDGPEWETLSSGSSGCSRYMNWRPRYLQSPTSSPSTAVEVIGKMERFRRETPPPSRSNSTTLATSLPPASSVLSAGGA